MVFVTGGNGLLGSFAIRQLIIDGYQVRALYREGANLDLLADVSSHIEWVKGDLHDVPLLQNCMQSCEYIVHTAALVSFSPKNRRQMYATNVEGTANLVNIALDLPIKKFVYLSSIASLGRTNDQIVIDENSKWQDSDLNSYYAKTKYLAELEVWRGIAEGLKAVILNPAVVLGVGDWDKSSTQLFKYVWKQHTYYPDGQLTCVDVRDVAKVISKVCFSPIVGERFILSAGEISYKTFFDLIAKHFNKKAPSKQLNPILAGIAWRVAAFIAFFTRKTPFITRETANISGNHFSYPNQKIKDMLGYEFESIEKTIEWACKGLIMRNN